MTLSYTHEQTSAMEREHEIIYKAVRTRVVYKTIKAGVSGRGMGDGPERCVVACENGLVFETIEQGWSSQPFRIIHEPFGSVDHGF